MSCTTEPQTQKNDDVRKYLGSKAPYFPNEIIQSNVPDSLTAVGIAMVTRHGSRYMSSPDEDIALFKLLDKAKNEGQLTKSGFKLHDEISKLTQIQKGNYGNLSTIGFEEHAILGGVLGKQYAQLFANTKIEANSTYKQRTKESRTSFLKALSKEVNSPLEIIENNNPKGKDPVLRFHKICRSYDLYEEEARYKKQYDSILNGDTFQKINSRIIEGIFKKDFSKILISGNFPPIENGEGEISIATTNHIILALYECLKISEGLKKEGATSLYAYFKKHELEELYYLSNIESFYEKGAGFENTNITYKIAAPLLLEFLKKTDASVKKDSSIVFLNFAHAETVAPFAVLTDLQANIAHQNRLPENYYNESELIKMSSNVQWIIYASPSNSHYIKILYNEQEMSLPLKAHGTALYLWNDVFTHYKNTLTKMDIPIETTDYEVLLNKM